MKLLKLLTMASLMVFLTAGLSACSDDKAENAGEKIDEMIQDSGNAVEDACEDLKEGMKAEDTDC